MKNDSFDQQADKNTGMGREEAGASVSVPVEQKDTGIPGGQEELGAPVPSH